MVNAGGKRDDAEDKKHSSFALIRTLYMVYSMAIGCVLPFLSLYYKSLGHGGQIIGLIGSISPITTFLVGPIWGIISDKVENPFFILYITSVMSMIGQLLVFLMDDTQSIVILVCVTALFNTPVKPLIDSLVMARLGRDRNKFGKLRLFSILGSGIATSVAGRFLKMEENQESNPPEGDKTITWLGQLMRGMNGFKLLAFAYALLHIPTLICLRLFHKEYETETKTVEKVEKKNKNLAVGMKKLIGITIRDKSIILFFSFVYLMGISAAIGDSFVYIRFQEVGGTGANMGTSKLISSLGGAVMFWHSGNISAGLGMDRVMALSLAIVAVRFTFLYFMRNIYFGYFAELLRGMTFGCFWSSANVHASRLAPAELQVTMIQILSGVYNGIGRSSGALIGGNLQAVVGTADTFKYGAMANAIAASLFIVHMAAKKHIDEKKEQ